MDQAKAKQQPAPQAQATRPDKKAYSTPKLVVYGNMQWITKAVSNMSPNADGGMGLTNKTR